MQKVNVCQCPVTCAEALSINSCLHFKIGFELCMLKCFWMYRKVVKRVAFSYILLLSSLPFYLTILKTTEGEFWVIVDLQSVIRNISQILPVSLRAFCPTGISYAEFIYLFEHFLSLFLLRLTLIQDNVLRPSLRRHLNLSERLSKALLSTAQVIADGRLTGAGL